MNAHFLPNFPEPPKWNAHLPNKSWTKPSSMGGGLIPFTVRPSLSEQTYDSIKAVASWVSAIGVCALVIYLNWTAILGALVNAAIATLCALFLGFTFVWPFIAAVPAIAWIIVILLNMSAKLDKISKK